VLPPHTPMLTPRAIDLDESRGRTLSTPRSSTPPRPRPRPRRLCDTRALEPALPCRHAASRLAGTSRSSSRAPITQSHAHATLPCSHHAHTAAAHRVLTPATPSCHVPATRMPRSRHAHTCHTLPPRSHAHTTRACTCARRRHRRRQRSRYAHVRSNRQPCRHASRLNATSLSLSHHAHALMLTPRSRHARSCACVPDGAAGDGRRAGADDGSSTRECVRASGG
jgi:hypothetical protein